MSDLGINADGIPMLRFPKEPCGAYSPDLIQVVRLLIVAGIDQDLKSYEMWPLTQSMYIYIYKYIDMIQYLYDSICYIKIHTCNMYICIYIYSNYIWYTMIYQLGGKPPFQDSLRVLGESIGTNPLGICLVFVWLLHLRWKLGKSPEFFKNAFHLQMETMQKSDPLQTIPKLQAIAPDLRAIVPKLCAITPAGKMNN